jgi:hypothetical protein
MTRAPTKAARKTGPSFGSRERAAGALSHVNERKKGLNGPQNEVAEIT